MKRNYNQLSLDERRILYRLVEAGQSKTRIASHLGRHRSTIYRELQRNTLYHEDPYVRGYFHVVANDLAGGRRTRLRKLARHSKLKAFVIEKLKRFWSPDQISGHLRRKAIEGFYACRETIYEFIYSPEGRSLKLYGYLRRAFMKRRKRIERKPRHLRGIPLNLSISYRPEEVKDRNNFGHWEADLMLFRKEHGQANITTLVERKSRYTLLLKNQNRQSKAVLSRIRDEISTLPRHSRRTITFDRGSEFTAWPVLDKVLDLGSFYCDPRAPWQRGTNENTNGRLRRFLPSDTDINEFALTDLLAVCQQINHTPRRILNFRTPHEVFHEHLLKTQE